MGSLFKSSEPPNENVDLVASAQHAFKEGRFPEATATSRRAISKLSVSTRPNIHQMELQRAAYTCLGMSSFHERQYPEAEVAFSEAIAITKVLYAESKSPKQRLDNLEFLVDLERQRLPALITQGKWELYDKYMSESSQTRINAAATFPLHQRIDILLSLIEDLQSSASNNLINPDKSRAGLYCAMAFQLMKKIREVEKTDLSTNQQHEISRLSVSITNQLSSISDREGMAKSLGLASSEELIPHLKREANKRAENDTGLMYFSEVDESSSVRPSTEKATVRMEESSVQVKPLSEDSPNQEGTARKANPERTLKSKLRELKELLDDGLITEDDYTKKKEEHLRDF